MSYSLRRNTIINENSSQYVFKLRKEGQLIEAYNLAIKLYNQNPTDEWVQKAYAWILIDIVKNEINLGTNNAVSFFNQLLSINIVADNLITKQINFLKPKLDSHYQSIQKATELSKKGDHAQALDSFRQLQNQGQLSEQHHETFGWAIYRYIKSSNKSLAINDVKSLFMEYLKLKTPRPSLLHSFILKIAIEFSKNHHDFNLYNFFQIWNPEYLRDEDKKKETVEDNNDCFGEVKTYPSLVDRLLKQFVSKNYQMDIAYLQSVIGNNELVIEPIRESYFWQIFNLHKSSHFNELWKLFDNYASNYSLYGASHWHSEILKLADRFMSEKNSWRFYDFLQAWNINNFQNADWHEEIRDDYKSKPLVKKALKKMFESIKLDSNKGKDIQWILPVYQQALKSFDNDIWILREYASLLSHSGKKMEAISIYKDILMDLNDQAYVWHEFAQLLADFEPETSISMLCKAISLQKNEDFLGDVRLLLSKLLVNVNKLDKAKIELNIYKNHRQEKGWKLSDELAQFDSQQLQEIEVSGDNLGFYETQISLAEDYLYSDIPWQDFLLHDQWMNKKQVQLSAFTDLGSVEFIVKSNKFEALKSSAIHSVIQFKLHFDKANNKYNALQAQASACSYDDFKDNASSDIAIVDHINNKKNLFHFVINSNLNGIVRFSQTELKPKVGDFLEVKYFMTYDEKERTKRLHVLNIAPSEEENTSLIKIITGELNLKYKYNGRTIDYQDISNNDTIDKTKPDFAFISDYYVAKYHLRKNQITQNCKVTVKALYNGEKWSVFELDKNKTL